MTEVGTRQGDVAAVVLAAGAGLRMGTPKALVSLGGELLVERAIRLAASAGCDPVLVVLGAESERVLATASLDGAEPVIAADWEQGMSASFTAGLSAAQETRAGAAVLLLVDQPLVSAAALNRLQTAWRAGAQVAVATYAGRARNPVLFDRSVWASVVESVTGDIGARPWLQAHPEIVVPVECADVASAADVDTPEDLAGLE
ncbi:MAG TPA: nucleotidyltransferase family protein [Mycobacteriales bacterium]|nr:nucleotidyltransferase family protein [Mycobacteriales bacterium]